MATEDKRADLVFEGGGVKGIGLGGAFSRLYDDGWRPVRVAGTSAGAITAAAVAAGYTGDELKQIVLEGMDFPKFADGHGALGETVELLHRGGLHSGHYFLEWMRDLLAAKGVEAFADLPAADDGKDAGGRHPLEVVVTDLTERRMLVLPRDADRLGKRPEELQVAEAVRMSMSIPIFFEPWIVHDASTGSDLTLVDGGVLSNFPVWLFDCPGDQEPRWPTFGVLLVAPDQRSPLVAGPEPEVRGARPLTGKSFLLAIAHTMMEAHDRLYVEQAEFARTIPVPTLGVRTTEFDIDPAARQKLFQAGYDAAGEFLATWDFAAYRRAFRRTGVKTTRRERVVAQMRGASE